VPEVKLCRQQVQIVICPSMMRDSASLRNVPPENTVVNEMTSATLLRIGGVSGAEPIGRSEFHALAGPLRQVWWTDKFKTGNIYWYDDSSNPEEFIQVYQTVIEVAGGDDRVEANFLPTTLTGAARSWLINLPEGSVTSWDQLYAMFIGNFQGTYEHQSTTETLKTIR
jgi:hypothetical protein